MTSYIWLLLAVIVIAVVLMPRERFQPEFLDRAQVKKTQAVEDSSYAQRTNHMSRPSYSMGPIAGSETPFQVNQYKAYVA